MIVTDVISAREGQEGATYYNSFSLVSTRALARTHFGDSQRAPKPRRGTVTLEPRHLDPDEAESYPWSHLRPGTDPMRSKASRHFRTFADTFA
jgi:hypothetical protein